MRWRWGHGSDVRARSLSRKRERRFCRWRGPYIESTPALGPSQTVVIARMLQLVGCARSSIRQKKESTREIGSSVRGHPENEKEYL